MLTQPGCATHPLWSLAPDELELVTQFVLASGSLKDLAHYYGVSYPTIRARLDDLIGRVQELIAEHETDPMTGLLDDLVSRGELTGPAAQSILEAHRRDHVR